MAANEKTSTEIMKEKFEAKELNAEQLEVVSGGLDQETKLDSYFLNYMLGNDVCRRWQGSDGKLYNDTDIFRQVRDAWRKVGVEFVADYSDKNEYYIDGKQVSRRQALEHAQSVLGKKVTDRDWMPGR